LIQAAIPDILKTEQQFHDENMSQLEKNATTSVKLLSGIPGIKVVAPQGAMYLMLELDLGEFKDIKDDVDFVEKLAEAEAVLCLPGQCFRCEKPFVRIVFSSPLEILEDAYGRIRSFCEKSHK
jgi:tyrosine aminotransferase